MNNKIYFIGLFIVSLCVIGSFVCRFVFNSNFYGVYPSDFLAIGLILNLILSIWKMLKDRKTKEKESVIQIK